MGTRVDESSSSLRARKSQCECLRVEAEQVREFTLPIYSNENLSGFKLFERELPSAHNSRRERTRVTESAREFQAKRERVFELSPQHLFPLAQA